MSHPNSPAGDVRIEFGMYTLQEINISHLGKRKIIFKMHFSGDMLVPRRVVGILVVYEQIPIFYWVVKASHTRKNEPGEPPFCSHRGSTLKRSQTLYKPWKSSRPLKV